MKLSKFKNPFKFKYRTVQRFVDNVVGLCLEREDCVQLPPVPGCGAYGPIRINGSTLPAINYSLWDQKSKNFVQISVFPQAIRSEQRYKVTGQAKYLADGSVKELTAHAPELQQFWKLVRITGQYWPLLAKPISPKQNVNSGGF